MQAAEAITLLIQVADGRNDGRSVDPADPQEEQIEIAVSIAQAMLNSMIVVARFRLFVRIESGDYKGAEYTVCCTDVKAVKAAAKSLRFPRRELYLQLWEQRATGADMLVGYQGGTADYTGNQNNFNRWIEELGQFEIPLN